MNDTRRIQPKGRKRQNQKENSRNPQECCKSTGRPRRKSGPKSTPPEERFWKNVHIGQPDECWPWGSGAGYGRFQLPGRKLIGAHQYAWEQANKTVKPDVLIMLHICDNPPCCNPAHLRVGTYKDNTQDCIAKKRWKPYRGGNPRDRNGNAKLSTADVQVLLKMRARGTASRVIAESFSITRQAVTYILRTNQQQQNQQQ